jgi:hypothetical protein
MNILKLLILTPILWILCVLIAGSYWPVIMVLALAAGTIWLRVENNAKKQRAHLQAQAIAQLQAAKTAAIEAQVKAEQARVRAEQLRIDATKTTDSYLKGQFN